MLRQALGTYQEDLNFTTIEDVVKNKTPESQYLDYKELQPENREFSRDVAAMANGGGGVIVVGVADKNNIPTQIRPISLTNEVARLEQIFGTNIQPFCRLRFHEISISDLGDKGVIVIEVLPSEQTPYAVNEGSGRLGFYTRTGQHRYPLSESQVSQMYRDRFRQQLSVDERLNELTSHANDRFVVHDGMLVSSPARVYVAAVPAVSTTRLFRPNGSTIQKLRDRRNRWRPIISSQLGEAVPQEIRTGFRRVEFTRHRFSVDQVSEFGWSECYDDAAFLGVIPGFSGNVPHGGEGTVFVDSRLVIDFLGRLWGYWILARHFGFDGEIVVRAGVTGPGVPALIMDPRRVDPFIIKLKYYDEGVGLLQSVENIATNRSIDINEIDPGPKLITLAKDLLDDIFTAFGWPEAHQLTQEGAIRQRYFHTDYRNSLQQWCANHNITMTDEVVP